MKLKELKNVEKQFFEHDEDSKVSKIVLKYEKPDDIFDKTCVSAIPLLSMEALAYIGNAFSLVPRKHKIDLTLRFSDMSGYTEEELMDILEKNFMLEMESKLSASKRRNHLAYTFIGAGVLFFFAMSMVKTFWTSESIWKDLFFYLFDIITTVSLYEAVTILSVEREEKMATIINLRKRFSAIHFEKSEE